jgi:hypothetical protein
MAGADALRARILQGESTRRPVYCRGPRFQWLPMTSLWSNRGWPSGHDPRIVTSDKRQSNSTPRSSKTEVSMSPIPETGPVQPPPAATCSKRF